jgi:hypothetical protein
MSKIKKRTSLFIKFLYGSVFFTLAGYIASAVPSFFSKDYSNVAPKLVESVQADTGFYNIGGDGFDGDGGDTGDGVDGGVDGGCDAAGDSCY